jgi:hypothetical protein
MWRKPPVSVPVTVGAGLLCIGNPVWLRRPSSLHMASGQPGPAEDWASSRYFAWHSVFGPVVGRLWQLLCSGLPGSPRGVSVAGAVQQWFHCLQGQQWW